MNLNLLSTMLLVWIGICMIGVIAAAVIVAAELRWPQEGVVAPQDTQPALAKP